MTGREVAVRCSMIGNFEQHDEDWSLVLAHTENRAEAPCAGARVDLAFHLFPGAFEDGTHPNC